MRQVCAENPLSGQKGVCVRGIRTDHSPTKSIVGQALQSPISGTAWRHVLGTAQSGLKVMRHLKMATVKIYSSDLFYERSLLVW
jgi:hypothetical protein